MDRNPVSLPAGFNPNTWKLKVEIAGKLVIVAEPVSQAEEFAALKTSKAAIEMARLREAGFFMILLFDLSVFYFRPRVTHMGEQRPCQVLDDIASFIDI